MDQYANIAHTLMPPLNGQGAYGQGQVLGGGLAMDADAQKKFAEEQRTYQKQLAEVQLHLIAAGMAATICAGNPGAHFPGVAGYVVDFVRQAIPDTEE